MCSAVNTDAKFCFDIKDKLFINTTLYENNFASEPAVMMALKPLPRKRYCSIQ